MSIKNIWKKIYLSRYFPCKDTRKKWLRHIVWSVPIIIAILSLWTAYKAKNLAASSNNIATDGNKLAADANKMAKDAVERLEVEKIVIQFYGGVARNDYKTRFETIPSLDGHDKTVITTLWPIIICNNGSNTVSIIAYDTSSRIHGRKRNIETRVLDKQASPTSLPLVIGSGGSLKIFLVVPIHIPSSVFRLVQNLTEFSESFTPEELDKYLTKKHRLDFYGNTYLDAEKVAGLGSDSALVHMFIFNEDDTLNEKGMQADQLTIEFKTARDNYFSARALYYGQPTFKSSPTIYHQRGTPFYLKREPMDSLPKTDDSIQSTTK